MVFFVNSSSNFLAGHFDSDKEAAVMLNSFITFWYVRTLQCYFVAHIFACRFTHEQFVLVFFVYAF